MEGAVGERDRVLVCVEGRDDGVGGHVRGAVNILQLADEIGELCVAKKCRLKK